MDPYWASKLSDYLVEVSKARSTPRRKLLRFISDNKEKLKSLYFQNQAKRGYLKDLDDFQIQEAVKEIYKGGKN